MPRQRGDVWYVDYYDEYGKRQVLATDAKNKTAARDLEAKLRAEAKKRRSRIARGEESASVNPRGMTFREGCEYWIEHVAPTLGGGQRAAYIIKAHLMTAPFAEKRLEDVKRGDINALMQAKRKTLSANSATKIGVYASAVYKRLSDADLWLGTNPAKGRVKFEADEQVVRAFPAASVNDLLLHLPPDWKLAATIAAYTGMRIGEIARLKWKDVWFERRIVHVVKTKKKKDRLVAIHSQLLPVLRAAFESATSEFVFPAPRKGGQRTTLRGADVVRNALRRAELTFEGVDECFHSLRHTWATRLMELDANRDVVEFMGWGTRPTSTRLKVYTQFSDEKLLSTIELLSYPPAKRIADVIPLRARRTK